MLSGDRSSREETRRKQQRILQVREQSKEIAAKLRKRITDERERQKDHIEQLKIDELRKWRDGRVAEQQGRYDQILATTLDANEEARRELEANFEHNQRKKELDLIAAQRGRTAWRKASECRAPKQACKKPKSKSTEVQTDQSLSSGQYYSTIDGLQKENYPQVMGTTSIKPTLPPKSSSRDQNIPIPSDRSLDILEKSKRFVDDASRRLDEISAKIIQSKQVVDEQGDQPQKSNEMDRSTKIKAPAAVQGVKTNNATRLRCNLTRKPVTEKKPPHVSKRPKTVVSSAAPEYLSSGAPEKTSVTCYDHPNRFTKMYDIPKNIVVKNVADKEDNAVTNAFNETLTQIEETYLRMARSKELREKEAVREIEALEKSQVRRDYEMLAKTLDEVRKTRANSPGSGHQYVNGTISQAIKHVPLAKAFDGELLHLPIRISCPRVDGGGQDRLNVGDVDQNDFSGSDSAKTIVLDHVANERNKETQINEPGVVLVTENNAPNVKLLAVSDEGKFRDGPLKIIIQVESTQPRRDSYSSDALKPRRIRTMDDSVSTNYFSPPSEIETQMGRYLSPSRARNRTKPGKKGIADKKSNADLKFFITRLLQMPQNEVEKLSDGNVSEITTPSNSIIHVEPNISSPLYDEKKLSEASRMIESNYSILEEVDELIAQTSLKEVAKDKVTKEAYQRATGSTETVPTTDAIRYRYATMSQNYTDRIHSLDKMINVIRAEKETLLYDNGISNVTTSERDTSTKYKDFVGMGRTMPTSTSGSELDNDSGDGLGPKSSSLALASGKSVPLGTNKIIGLSRDSGISMSRPVTSTEVRESQEERGFEPLLKDIPRPKQHGVTNPSIQQDNIEQGKRRPPNSISRYSPEAIQAAGHDLSTIIEVDTPGTGPVAAQEQIAGDLKRFPTIDEFVAHNGTNTSILSDLDRGEVVAVKPFVSFKQFVDNNVTDKEATELDLSEIAEELRRRSLLGNKEKGKNEEGDKKYLRSLSQELEDMIEKINPSGRKEPNFSATTSFKDHSGAGEQADYSTIGKLLDKIKQPEKFPTREEFNLQNNSKHYKSAEILKSFLEGSVGEVDHDTKENVEKMRPLPPPAKRAIRSEDNRRGAVAPQSSNNSASGSQKKSSESSKSQPLNLSDDLMNALENNLSEMGLKWAVNMLKRSHQQISSSTSISSSSENISREPIPFESKTMSLLTDLEKSPISDESKTSNIKNIIIRELLRSRLSGNNSSNGSLSSGIIDRSLLINADQGSGSDDGRCLRTSTPVNSNFNSISQKVGGSSSTIVDAEKSGGVDVSDLFSGESKLSSVRDEVPSYSHHRLNVPKVQLDTGKYLKPTDSTLSTEYSLNEHNKRRMTTKRTNKDK